VSGGGEGLGRAQSRLEAAKEGPERTVAVRQALSRQPQRRRGPVRARSSLAREPLPPEILWGGHKTEPGGKVFLGRPAAHGRADLTEQDSGRVLGKAFTRRQSYPLSRNSGVRAASGARCPPFALARSGGQGVPSLLSPTVRKGAAIWPSQPCFAEGKTQTIRRLAATSTRALPASCPGVPGALGFAMLAGAVAAVRQLLRVRAPAQRALSILRPGTPVTSLITGGSVRFIGVSAFGLAGSADWQR